MSYLPLKVTEDGKVLLGIWSNLTSDMRTAWNDRADAQNKIGAWKKGSGGRLRFTQSFAQYNYGEIIKLKFGNAGENTTYKDSDLWSTRNRHRLHWLELLCFPESKYLDVGDYSISDFFLDEKNLELTFDIHGIRPLDAQERKRVAKKAEPVKKAAENADLVRHIFDETGMSKRTIERVLEAAGSFRA